MVSLRSHLVDLLNGQKRDSKSASTMGRYATHKSAYTRSTQTSHSIIHIPYGQDIYELCYEYSTSNDKSMMCRPHGYLYISLGGYNNLTPYIPMPKSLPKHPRYCTVFNLSYKLNNLHLIYFFITLYTSSAQRHFTSSCTISEFL